MKTATKILLLLFAIGQLTAIHSMQIATTTEDFTDYVAKDDIAGAVRLLAQCGFRHIDLSLALACFDGSRMLSEDWEAWVEEIRQAAAETGVDFVQAHASDGAYDPGPEYDKRMARLKREIQVCKALGIPGMVVHAVCKPDTSRKAFLDANERFYRELLEAAEPLGVKIYTENSCRQNAPYYYLFDAMDMNALRGRLGNHPLFGFCWDVGHANCHGVDQYQEILAMGDGLQAVHIHDTSSITGLDAHLAPYTGNTNYDAVLNGLVDIGFNGAFTLEAFSLPVPQTFCICNRPHFLQKGPECDRLGMLPLEFKLRSERLMYDIVKYMLDTYDCFDD